MVQAVNDRVFVRRSERPTKSAGGIILVNPTQDNCAEGVIQSVGHKVEHLKAGDKVVFNPKVGYEIKVEGETLFVTVEKEVLGVFDTDESQTR